MFKTMNTIVLTHSIIHSAATNHNGFNRPQLELLGVSWPPQKGWLSSLIGKEISAQKWQLVLQLKSVRRKSDRKAILSSQLELA